MQKKFFVINPDKIDKYEFTQGRNYRGRVCTVKKVLKTVIHLVNNGQTERKVAPADGVLFSLEDMKVGTTVTLASNVQPIFDLWQADGFYDYMAIPELNTVKGEELVVVSVLNNGYIEVYHEASETSFFVPFAAAIPDFDSQAKDLSLPLLKRRLPDFFKTAKTFNSSVCSIIGDKFITYESYLGKSGYTVRRCIAHNTIENLSKLMQFANQDDAIRFAQQEG